MRSSQPRHCIPPGEAGQQRQRTTTIVVADVVVVDMVVIVFIIVDVIVVVLVGKKREREESFTHIFADDTKVSNTVPDNTDVIQKDLDSLQAWSESWQLRFNVEYIIALHNMLCLLPGPLAC